MRIKRGETSILALDFSVLDEEQKNWETDRNLKIELWRAYQNRILFLENMVSYDGNSDFKWLIEKEIKKLKKQQKHFEVEPLICFAPDYSSEQDKVKKK